MSSNYRKKREIPYELVVEILARVPAKDLLRFRCVCKSWRSLFQDERFIRQHMSHAPTRILSLCGLGNAVWHFFNESAKPEMILEELNLKIGDKSFILHSGVIGYCNGLFCLNLRAAYSIGIWSPSFRELRIIPRRRHIGNWGEVGFGYDHSTQDYKIVLVPDLDGRRGFKAQVLSLKSGVSRMIDFPCLENFEMCHIKIGGTLVGESLYWQVYDDKVKLTETMLRFDLVSETFNYCSAPRVRGPRHPEVIKGLRGSLCTVVVDLCNDVTVTSAQHEKGGVIKSWSKMFILSRGMFESSISRRIDNLHVVSTITYAGLLFFLLYIGREAKLLAYNLEERSLRHVETNLSLDGCGRLHTYVETLVPIPDALFK